MMPQRIHAALDVPPALNRGGRPRKPNTLVVTVRLAEDVYDAYCRESFRLGLDVRTLLREALTREALRKGLRGSKPDHGSAGR